MSYRRYAMRVKRRISAILITISILLSSCAGNGSTRDNMKSSEQGNVKELSSTLSNISEDDLNTDYDKNSSTKITLNGNNISIKGKGAAQSGNTVTISSAGTYILSGKLSDGQILIDATNVDVVWIVFDQLVISSIIGSAVYVKQAKKVIITLADGSQNTISDAKEYANTGDDKPDAAIYSSDDLTFNGEGTLTVNGNYKHAIKTADDLVIVSGTYDITSQEEGIRGKDSVSIAGGHFTIKSDGEAIKSTNDKNSGSGWIMIDGGEFNISSKKNGIEAKSKLHISGGRFDIDSARDALHSSGDLFISDGELNLSANDDGVHSGGPLEVSGGKIIVTQSLEGLEGANITISGGSVSVTSSDDGLNAAGGSDGELQPDDSFIKSSEYFISITGGYTYINAGGDGIDSNGDVYISGGTLIVDGPSFGHKLGNGHGQRNILHCRRNSCGGRLFTDAYVSHRNRSTGINYNI